MKLKRKQILLINNYPLFEGQMLWRKSLGCVRGIYVKSLEQVKGAANTNIIAFVNNYIYKVASLIN